MHGQGHSNPCGAAAIAAAGLLPQVFSNLCDPHEIVLCGAVCKAWHNAATNVAFERLHIQPRRQVAGSCVGLRGWLVEQLKHGNIASLTEMLLGEGSQESIQVCNTRLGIKRHHLGLLKSCTIREMSIDTDQKISPRRNRL